MTDPATGARRYGTVFDGTVFDGIASEYDRHRPTYPDELLDQACRIGGLRAGDRVLEIGCGSGQLTGSLVARGLHVTAVEPGRRLIALAEQNVRGHPQVAFLNARFEDAQLPAERFRAVFSASAMHWVDPDLSWRKAADVLATGGLLGLIQYFGLRDVRSVDDQDAWLAGLRRIAPDLAARWPTYRDLDGVLAGAEQRSTNVSELWAWLGSYDVARDYPGDLFDDVRIAVAPRLLDQTADELNALVATMSFYAQLSSGQRDALRAESVAIEQRLGRPIRSSTVGVLVTARRRD
jgi:SAM-dependent methyltransferase